MNDYIYANIIKLLLAVIVALAGVTSAAGASAQDDLDGFDAELADALADMERIAQPLVDTNAHMDAGEYGEAVETIRLGIVDLTLDPGHECLTEHKDKVLEGLQAMLPLLEAMAEHGGEVPVEAYDELLPNLITALEVMEWLSEDVDAKALQTTICMVLGSDG